MGKKTTNRPPVPERAGTTLDWRYSRKVNGTIAGKSQEVGAVDSRQRIFQVGGELSNFVYWKTRQVSVPLDAWNDIQQEADWWELVDHENNRCYKISLGLANSVGSVYDAGIGKRWGVPLGYFQVLEKKEPLVRGRRKKHTQNPQEGEASLF